ncbi:MAG: hypothetical protein KF856_11920 [Cyclobacteriaceae bacterium]|nr:hypothetical protein [Cyclobacteriaceae bacterium]
MVITDRQIEYGFWNWDKSQGFPPDSVKLTDDFKGGLRLNIACTQQLDLKPTEQKRLVKNWVSFLPACDNLEFLWFTTHTTQELFDSACKLDNLVGLYIKWSSIKSLNNITNLKKLKYLRIGSSAKIESIEPLRQMTNLEVLEIENFKKISDFSSLKQLTNLKFLEIAGGMYTKQNVDSFEPIGSLTNLIYFSTAMIRCPDKSLDSILKLKKLQTFNWPFDLSTADMNKLRKELPNLKYLPHRYLEENMRKIKEAFG